MKALLAILLLIQLPVRALLITNGVWAGTNAPPGAIGWAWNAHQCTAIGWKVMVGVKHVSYGNRIVYEGITNEIDKTIDVATEDIRFLIMRQPLKSWAPIATNGWTSAMTPFEHVWIVADGAACNSSDGTNCITNGEIWYWGANKTKRIGQAAVTCTRGKFWWRFNTPEVIGGNAAAADGDSGNSTYTKDWRFLGPISSGNNPVKLDTYSGGALVRPFLGAVADWLNPPTNTVPALPVTVTNVKVEPK
jgi:hypothetical protein